jgi:Tfp pilus assembly protein FimT
MRFFTSGSTLVELVLTLALLCIVAALAVPSVLTIADRLSVRAAAHDVVLGLGAARAAAVRYGEVVQFVADARRGRVSVVAGADTLFARDLAARHRVRLAATRESVTYAPTGLGWGAANTTIIVSRGRRADTITTSRLGRVWWR